LGFDATNGIENSNGTIQDPQGSFYFDGEINVPRRVDNIDSVVAPEAGRGSAGNCNSTLLLLLHPIHRGGAVVHLANLVGYACVVEDSFRSRGLTGINVGHDTDVARIF